MLIDKVTRWDKKQGIETQVMHCQLSTDSNNMTAQKNGWDITVVI